MNKFLFKPVGKLLNSYAFKPAMVAPVQTIFNKNLYFNFAGTKENKFDQTNTQHRDNKDSNVKNQNQQNHQFKEQNKDQNKDHNKDQNKDHNKEYNKEYNKDKNKDHIKQHNKDQKDQKDQNRDKKDWEKNENKQNHKNQSDKKRQDKFDQTKKKDATHSDHKGEFGVDHNRKPDVSKFDPHKKQSQVNPLNKQSGTVNKQWEKNDALKDKKDDKDAKKDHVTQDQKDLHTKQKNADNVGRENVKTQKVEKPNAQDKDKFNKDTLFNARPGNHQIYQGKDKKNQTDKHGSKEQHKKEEFKPHDQKADQKNKSDGKI